MIKCKLILFWLFAALIGFRHAYAYDDSITHPALTTKATYSSILDAHLKKFYSEAFLDGIRSVVNGKAILDWLTQGSKEEDRPMCRASHHFHNPLLPWRQSQMSDTPWMDYICDVPRYSTVTWATGYYARQGAKVNVAVSPLYSRASWDNARNDFYKTLASANLGEREKYFAETFKGIGHIIHLLQDMAVPAHVRNDFQSHIIPASLSPLSLLSSSNYYNRYERHVAKLPSIYHTAMFPQFINSMTLTDFWDTEIYDGTNPSVNLSQGLAEFANANFFSEFTIPFSQTVPVTPEHTFPQPAADYYGNSYQLCSDANEYGHIVKYLSRTNCPTSGPGKVDHFLTVSLVNVPKGQATHFWTDAKVHDTYATELLPRAVGYSAALIDYFFRGKLDAHLTLNGIRVINKSDEEMTVYTEPSTNESIGTIDIYYDNMQNERKLLANYKLAGSSTPVIPPGGMTELIRFERPIDNIAESRYILVFRGRLGNEDGAVAGRVYVPSVYYAAKQNGVDRILKVNIDATGRTVVFDNDDPNILLGRFSFSSDETKAAINILTPNDPNADLYLLDSTTGGLAYLTKGNTPVLSPDGDRIAFSYEKGSGFPSADEQLAIYDLTAGTSVDLPIQDRGSYIHPAWSPNGNSLAYSRWPGGENCRNQAAIVVLTGTTERVLACENETENFVVDTMPAWSPDGREIAFVRAQDVGQPYSLYKVNVATGLVTRLTGPAETGYDEQFPTWSPDGATIAISSNRSGHLDVWLVGANGEGYLRNLTADNAESDGMPVFGK